MRRAWLPVVTALVCACSGPPTPGPTATLGPGLSSPDPRASQTLVAGASAAAVPIDVSLLRYLPAAIGDFPVTYSAEATQDVARDRTLASTAGGVAYGMAADPVSGDVVVAAVV